MAMTDNRKYADKPNTQTIVPTKNDNYFPGKSLSNQNYSIGYQRYPTTNPKPLSF